MTDDDLPTPEPTEPIPAWPEFDALRDAVEQYLDHEPPDPTYKRLSQALGVILPLPGDVPPGTRSL